jgi:hypothetical protein
MVKALRSCLEAAKGKIKAGHLILRKSPKILGSIDSTVDSTTDSTMIRFKPRRCDTVTGERKDRSYELKKPQPRGRKNPWDNERRSRTQPAASGSCQRRTVARRLWLG